MLGGDTVRMGDSQTREEINEKGFGMEYRKT
jgi:hypothetical protein